MDGSPGGVSNRAPYTNLRVLNTDHRVMDNDLRGLDTDPSIMDAHKSYSYMDTADGVKVKLMWLM